MKPKTIRMNHNCAWCKKAIYIEHEPVRSNDGFVHLKCMLDRVQQQTALATLKEQNENLIELLKEHRTSLTACHVECPCFNIQKLINNNCAEIQKLEVKK